VIGKRYGWLPDIPDSRDYLYSAIRPPVIRLPRKVNLCKACSRIEDQGALGSCTAQALAGNIEYLDNVIDNRYTDTSRLFIYYNERVLEDTVGYDSGAYLRTGIKTLRKDGACDERLWPYAVGKFTRRPPPACYIQGKKRRISSYHRIGNLQEMQVCLADGYPFVFGFTVYESFESAQVARTGVAPMPRKNERALGGHAVMAVGYDLGTKRFLVRNSWGTGWGMQGYFTLPFKYLETLAADFWTIRK